MKPIIVATDFSEPSANAAYYAAELAKSLHVDIYLIHVMEIPATTFQVPMTAIEFNEIENAARASLERLQKELTERTNNKISVHTEIQYGIVNFEIEKFAHQKNPLAIVVGIKRHSDTKRFFLGSNALRFIHHSLFPVLIVPENVVFKKIKNIAMASDLTNHQNSISILQTKEWLNALHGNFSIIHVKTEDKTEAWIDEGIKGLQNSFAEFSPKFCFINEKQIEGGVDTFNEVNKTDLLIVAPGRQGFLESIFQKSDAKEIILHAHLPVLSVFAGSFAESKEKKHHTENTNAHACKTCNGDCKNKNGIKKHIDETHLTA